MNKEQLTKMGLNDQQADDILRELDGAFIPKARFNEVNNELKSARQQLEESSQDKEQLETLRNKLREKTEEYSENLKKFKIDTAVNSALKNAGAKNSAAVKALLSDFIGNATLDENENVVGLQEEVQRLATEADTSFMFESADSGTAFSGFIPGEKADGIPEEPQSASLSDAIKMYIQGNY